MTARRRRPAPRRGAASCDRGAVESSNAETLLLALAREIGARSVNLSQPTDVGAIVDLVAVAYAPDAALAVALRQDWLRRRGDKAAQLALGWAREQVRLALLDVLQRARTAGVGRADEDVDTLAWLWLATSEALAHEPAGAVADRVQALAAFLTAR